MTSQNPRVIAGLNFSLLTPEEQRELHGLLKRHQVCLCRVTPAQRLEIFDIDDEKFIRLQNAIARTFEKSSPRQKAGNFKVTYVRSCPGIGQCRYAVADATLLGRRLDNMRFPEPFPHKVKISVAGCSMCCTEPYIRDVGIIGTRKGWSVSFGGNGGANPRIGDVLAKGLGHENAISLVEKSLINYCVKANRKERTARFIERYGIDKFKQEVLK